MTRLRIQALPQNDGIRNPITAVTASTFVNDTSESKLRVKKRRFGRPLRLLTQILPLQRIFESDSVSSSGVVTITYKDNTTNDVTAPVKRLAAPTVETRLLDKDLHTGACNGDGS